MGSPYDNWLGASLATFSYRAVSRCRGSFAPALIAATLGSAAGAPVDTAEGRWLTQAKSAIIEIYRCGDRELCGRLVWFRMKPAEQEHNPQALDIHNRTPTLRSRLLCGLVIMWGLQPEGPNQWGGGALYDPETGNTYSGKITLTSDDTLRLRGYIAVSLFGRSEEWTRFTQTITRCPAEQ